MATTTIFQIPSSFNMNNLVTKVSQLYQAKGFTVTAIPIGSGVTIDFRKDNDNIKKYVGLSLGIKANIMIQDENIVINYTDAEWTGKIFGFVIGWFLCWIPWIPTIIGTIRQSGLPKNIGNDIQMVSGGHHSTQPFTTASPQGDATPAAQTFCKHCGSVLVADEQFCGTCGTKTD
ncbi:MAG: zinc ribbon domain-containing protein [Clostridiales Family XIII bacterium]|jgi:hypothetical protein|nr:zinc ribbon domain-containing protein [Clostridiales Family XIII bacterium]